MSRIFAIIPYGNRAVHRRALNWGTSMQEIEEKRMNGNLARVLGLPGVPVAERVADRLADLLFDADDVIDMLTEERASSLRWTTPRLRSIFDQVDELMRRISD